MNGCEAWQRKPELPQHARVQTRPCFCGDTRGAVVKRVRAHTNPGCSAALAPQRQPVHAPAAAPPRAAPRTRAAAAPAHAPPHPTPPLRCPTLRRHSRQVHTPSQRGQLRIMAARVHPGKLACASLRGGAWGAWGGSRGGGGGSAHSGAPLTLHGPSTGSRLAAALLRVRVRVWVKG